MRKYLAELSTYAAAMLIVIFIVACDSTESASAEPFVNKHGQTILFMSGIPLSDWLIAHPDLKIVCITQAGNARHMPGYVIVYETPKIEK